MWDPEPWLQLHLLALHKNGLHKFNFCCTKMKKYNFSEEFKKQVSENIYFLIKVIYNILCIIKKYIKFENFSFSFKQTFSNPIFFFKQKLQICPLKRIKKKQKLVMSNSLSSKWITKKKIKL